MAFLVPPGPVARIGIPSDSGGDAVLTHEPDANIVHVRLIETPAKTNHPFTVYPLELHRCSWGVGVHAPSISSSPLQVCVADNSREGVLMPLRAELLPWGSWASYWHASEMPKQRVRRPLPEGVGPWKQRPVVEPQKTWQCFPMPSSPGLGGTFPFPVSTAVGMLFSPRQVREASWSLEGWVGAASAVAKPLEAHSFIYFFFNLVDLIYFYCLRDECHPDCEFVLYDQWSSL